MLQRKSFQVAALSPVQWADAAPVPGKELLQHKATGGNSSVIAWDRVAPERQACS